MAKPYKEQYDWQYQKERKAAKAAFRDGQPCSICTKPMRSWQSLDLNHLTPVTYGGASGPKALAHSWCNRRDGQRISAERKRNGLARIKSTAVNRNGRPRIGSATPKGGSSRGVPKRTLPKW